MVATERIDVGVSSDNDVLSNELYVRTMGVEVDDDKVKNVNVAKTIKASDIGELTRLV
jgi:hypothetical protein